MTNGSEPLVLDIFGVRVAVRGRDGDHATLRDLLAPIVAVAASDAASSSAAVPFDCSVEVEVANVESVVGAALVAAVDHSHDLLIHAGAVGRGGEAVIFPGVSGIGKSTMTAACLVRGMGYLSDEAVALDLETGLIAGLSRPLMLTPWSLRAMGLGGDHAGKQAVAAERLGGHRVAGTSTVAHVVSMRRDAGSAVLEPMTSGEVLAAVLASSFNHYRHGERAWEAATRLVHEARGWSVDITDLGAAADAVSGLLPR